MTDTTWRHQAACLNKPTGWWFPGHGEEPHPEAVALCESCPVRTPCLEAGLAGREHGRWGGTSERERRKMRQARRARGCVVCGGDVVGPSYKKVCDAQQCQREAKRRTSRRTTQRWRRGAVA